MFGALLALFGLLSSIKATTERLTQSWLRSPQGAAAAAADGGELSADLAPLAAALPQG